MPKIRLPKGHSPDEYFPAPSEMSVAAPLITLLSKPQQAANTARILENLAGTPFEAAAKAAAQKWPRVFGHLNSVNVADAGSSALGEFTPSTYARMGKPIGDITVADRPTGALSALKDWLDDANPADTIGHELTHAAQALWKMPPKFLRQYKDAESVFGYERNPFEVGARKGGAKLKSLVDKLR